MSGDSNEYDCEIPTSPGYKSNVIGAKELERVGVVPKDSLWGNIYLLAKRLTKLESDLDTLRCHFEESQR